MIPAVAIAALLALMAAGAGSSRPGRGREAFTGVRPDHEWRRLDGSHEACQPSLRSARPSLAPGTTRWRQHTQRALYQRTAAQQLTGRMAQPGSTPTRSDHSSTRYLVRTQVRDVRTAGTYSPTAGTSTRSPTTDRPSTTPMAEPSSPNSQDDAHKRREPQHADRFGNSPPHSVALPRLRDLTLGVRRRSPIDRFSMGRDIRAGRQ